MILTVGLLTLVSLLIWFKLLLKIHHCRAQLTNYVCFCFVSFTIFPWSTAMTRSVDSFIPSFTLSIVHSFILSFVHRSSLLIRLFVRLFVRPSTHPFVHSSIYLSIYLLLIYLLIDLYSCCLFVHSFSH